MTETKNQNTKKGVTMTHEIKIDLGEPTCNRRNEVIGNEPIIIALPYEAVEARAFVKEIGARWHAPSKTWELLSWSGTGEGLARIIKDLKEFGDVKIFKCAQRMLDDLA